MRAREPGLRLALRGPSVARDRERRERAREREGGADARGPRRGVTATTRGRGGSRRGRPRRRGAGPPRDASPVDAAPLRLCSFNNLTRSGPPAAGRGAKSEKENRNVNFRE